jgi:hypothetical protein
MTEQQSESVEEVIPLVEEHLSVSTRKVETGRVRVSTKVEERTEMVAAELQREDVTVERVPVNREIEAVPEVRWEGDTFIVPGGRRGAGYRKAPCSQGGAQNSAREVGGAGGETRRGAPNRRIS